MFRLNSKGFSQVLILLAALGIIAFILIANTGSFKDRLFGSLFSKPSSFASEAVNYYGKDISFFGLFGQSNYKSATRGKVSANSAYHGSGVIVDRSSNPNKIYFVDSGNNRVLGFNGGDGSDKAADLVIGQPDMNTGLCNLDSNLGFKGEPTASTLCQMSYPTGNNTAEQWGASNIDVDSEGNLYVSDRFNNRVLKYNQPFSTDKTGGKGDGVADFVWGQDDFVSNGPNKGEFFGTVNTPTNSSLNLTTGYGNPTAAGVSVDPVDGGIWVADFFNNRVLHFPQGSKIADVVLGQSSFTQTGCGGGTGSRMCSPIIARRDPVSKELYVIDIWPEGFQARFMVFKPDSRGGFVSGQTVDRIFKPNVPKQAGVNDWMFYPGTSNYLFKASGFVFNQDKTDYPTGLILVNEHEKYRTLLLDKDGNVVKVLHAKDVYHLGRDTTYIGCGGANVNTGDRVAWPNGSIGQDANNNLYFADEDNGRVVRYALPYDTYQNSGVTCPPDGNGSLLKRGWNESSNETIDETVGVLAFGDQLIVPDRPWSLKVWNDYKTRGFGAAADYVVGAANIAHPAPGFVSAGVDGANRLWVKAEHNRTEVFQLPFTSSNDAPIADWVKFYWADDDTEVTGGNFGAVAYDKLNDWLYVIQGARILRVKNYREVTSGRLLVDLVIGQRDKTTNSCNQGRGEGNPDATSLCQPAQIKFDKLGNLYVVDDSWECHGNRRITTFMADDLKNATGLFPNIAAKKVFNAPDFTSTPNCSYWVTNAPGTPITVGFNSKNQMVVGNDGYYGDASQRELGQLWFYADPLNKQTPDASISLYMGTPADLVFDDEDNLLVMDGTWYKVQMINLCKDPDWLEWLPGVEPINTCSSSQTTFIPGDINRNGRVEVFDFNLVLTDFGKTDTTSLRSDINKNGRVDVFDFNLVITNFGKSN